MYIEKISIFNYRGIEFESMELSKTTIIFGKNDSRKTTFFSAIRKVLDYQERKKELLETDSTNLNKKDIKIEITLNVSDINKEDENVALKYIYSIDDKKYLKIILEAKFNEKSNSYEETITIDAEGDPFLFSANRWIPPIDEIISIVFIPASYSLEDDKKSFFNFRKKIISEEEKGMVLQNVKASIDEFNNKVSLESFVVDMSDSINKNNKFQLMKDVQLNVSSVVKNNDIFKSLDIITHYQTKELSELGDGRNKILSLLLKLNSINNKRVILLIEEPENHLYVHYQKNLISEVEKFFNSDSQILCSTHSPFIIDYRKIDQLVKFEYKNGEFSFFSYFLVKNIDRDENNKGYFFNLEFAEVLYCEKVILIEGYSEKSFYNYLLTFDHDFFLKIVEQNIGFLFSFGVAFEKPKEILESLNIKVSILTDNDMNTDDGGLYNYFGIKRCYKYLNNFDKLEFNNLFKSLVENNFKLENKIKQECLNSVILFFEKRNIFLPNHHDGFERDFVNFLDLEEKEEVIKKLKKAKLKNLVELILKNQSLMKVKNTNKNNRLIKVI